MRVLAIETATAWGSVAVVDGTGVRAERAARVPGGHLEWLHPAIDAMLTAAALEPQQIDGLAVSIGPGSFTGLRIGVATATAWARALDRPLIAVSTLRVIAAGVQVPGLVLAAIDARRAEVVTALFRRNGETRRLTDDALVLPATLGDALPRITEPVVVAGDALERYAPVILGTLAPHAAAADRDAWRPKASVLGLLGRARLLRGERDDPVGLAPRYAQRPVAREYRG
jgi:tRNA threonylcarbamoyladenosine biosynthesis protein TsaB